MKGKIFPQTSLSHDKIQAFGAFHEHSDVDLFFFIFFCVAPPFSFTFEMSLIHDSKLSKPKDGIKRKLGMDYTDFFERQFIPAKIH